MKNGNLFYGDEKKNFSLNKFNWLENIHIVRNIFSVEWKHFAKKKFFFCEKCALEFPFLWNV